MNALTGVCKHRLEQFLRRDLSEWTGVPEACSEADVVNWLNPRPGEGLTHLGTDVIPYRFRVTEAAGFDEPIRVYFRDGALSLVRTGLWSSDREECDRVLKELGEPQARLDLVFGTGVIAGGEWVYAKRGLTVAVSPERGWITSASGYPPCSMDVYLRCLHDHEPVREFPGPSGR